MVSGDRTRETVGVFGDMLRSRHRKLRQLEAALDASVSPPAHGRAGGITLELAWWPEPGQAICSSLTVRENVNIAVRSQIDFDSAISLFSELD